MKLNYLTDLLAAECCPGKISEIGLERLHSEAALIFGQKDLSTFSVERIATICRLEMFFRRLGVERKISERQIPENFQR